MNLNKKAFSMTELMICIIIMMILAGVAVVNIKPNDNKTRLFVYSTMNNISNVVSTLVTNYSSLTDFDSNTVNGVVYDTLCLKMADYYSLQTSANCTRSAAESVVNITFPNGVTIQGLAAAWKDDTKVTPDNAKYQFKEIVFDIDGNTKGMNKVGVDRFPVRIYRKGVLEGSVVPVNCSLSNAGNYCKNGGTKTTINFTTVSDFISYDVFKAASASSTKADIKASNKSFIDVDCGVFGGLGYFTVAECAAAGKKVMSECVDEEICTVCNTDGKNICAMNGSTQLTSSTCLAYVKANNPDNLSCIILLHKPPMGGGVLLDTVVDSVGNN